MGIVYLERLEMKGYDSWKLDNGYDDANWIVCPECQNIEIYEDEDTCDHCLIRNLETRDLEKLISIAAEESDLKIKIFTDVRGKIEEVDTQDVLTEKVSINSICRLVIERSNLMGLEKEEESQKPQ